MWAADALFLCGSWASCMALFSVRYGYFQLLLFPRRFNLRVRRKRYYECVVIGRISEACLIKTVTQYMSIDNSFALFIIISHPAVMTVTLELQRDKVVVSGLFSEQGVQRCFNSVLLSRKMSIMRQNHRNSSGRCWRFQSCCRRQHQRRAGTDYIFALCLSVLQTVNWNNNCLQAI